MKTNTEMQEYDVHARLRRVVRMVGRDAWLCATDMIRLSASLAFFSRAFLASAASRARPIQ